MIDCRSPESLLLIPLFEYCCPFRYLMGLRFGQVGHAGLRQYVRPIRPEPGEHRMRNGVPRPFAHVGFDPALAITPFAPHVR